MKQSKPLITIASPEQFPSVFQKNGNLCGRNEPRIAFVGRSNVGKSSLINAILRNQCAKTSKTPGKTSAIQVYPWLLGHKILIDLPGYGYAKKNKGLLEQWRRLIDGYWDWDQNLEQVLVLLDSRHGPTPLDVLAIEFLSFKGIPVTFVLTKVDELKTQAQRVLRQKEVSLALQGLGIRDFSSFWVSHFSGAGLSGLVRFLTHGLKALGSG